MDEFKCIICETKFLIDNYGEGNCPTCGQLYEYEEHYQIVLSEKQVRLLNLEFGENGKQDNTKT